MIKELIRLLALGLVFFLNLYSAVVPFETAKAYVADLSVLGFLLQPFNAIGAVYFVTALYKGGRIGCVIHC